MDRGAEIGTIPEEAFSFDGYQVVRGEFFAHTFEPSITFCGSKLYVNMACLNKLPTVEYIQILVNQDTKKLVIRPCREDEKDSFRADCTLFHGWVPCGEGRGPAGRDFCGQYGASAGAAGEDLGPGGPE